MTPSIPGMDAPISKNNPNTPLRSSAPSAALSTPKVAKPLAQPKAWNTKNIGLRLVSDFMAGLLAAGTVAPLIAVIDKYASPFSLSYFNSDRL